MSFARFNHVVIERASALDDRIVLVPRAFLRAVPPSRIAERRNAAKRDTLVKRTLHGANK